MVPGSADVTLTGSVGAGELGGDTGSVLTGVVAPAQPTHTSKATIRTVRLMGIGVLLING
jgi:hypothetical protein